MDELAGLFSGGQALREAWDAAGIGLRLMLMAFMALTVHVWAVILRAWDRQLMERRVRDAYLDGQRAGFEVGYRAGLRDGERCHSEAPPDFDLSR